MSHTVSIRTQIRDPIAIAAACERLALPAPVVGTAKLFNSQASGLLVQLPDWRYPVVIDTTKGEIAFDNFNGRWGEQRTLDRLLQAYACEKAKLEARKRGHAVSESALADGSIRLQIAVSS